MKTLIFLPVREVRTVQMYASQLVHPKAMFPEVENGVPLMPKEILAKCGSLVGKTVFTTSEYVVLWFLKEVRLGRLLARDVLIGLVDDELRVHQMAITPDGDFEDRWPEGFFPDRGPLLFY